VSLIARLTIFTDYTEGFDGPQQAYVVSCGLYARAERGPEVQYLYRRRKGRASRALKEALRLPFAAIDGWNRILNDSLNEFLLKGDKAVDRRTAPCYNNLYFVAACYDQVVQRLQALRNQSSRCTGNELSAATCLSFAALDYITESLCTFFW